MPPTPLDEIINKLDIGAPTKGIIEGLDPATGDDVYPPNASPDLENLRVAGGRWETRKGMALWQNSPGSGAVRWLSTLYQSSGAKVRLLAQGNGTGATLYKLTEGTDTAFTAVSGGTGLGGTTSPYFAGTVNQDLYYITDRQNGLKKFNPSPSSGNQLIPVTQPVAPAAAPTARARPFAKLEDWTSPSWTDSTPAQFADSDDTAANAPPDGGKSRKLAVAGTGAQGVTIQSNTVRLVPAASHTIAFYTKQDTFNVQLGYQFGSVSRTDFEALISSPTTVQTNTWYPFYIGIGDLPQVPYNQFICTAVVSGKSGNVWVSAIYLPGLLAGTYRWVYTYYDPVSQRESVPSPITNSGQALDFSAEPVSFQNSTTRAFAKTCALGFVPSSDPTATQIRIYRSGGAPSLTVDDNGVDVWLLVATITPLATAATLTSNAGAGSTTLALAATTGIHVNDWLVLDQGVQGSEEYVQVSAVHPTSLTITNGLGAAGGTMFSHAMTTGTVQIAYVDNVPDEQINVTQRIDLERDDPPAGAQFIARAGDGRMWIFGYAGNPTGIAVSNRPTPLAQHDYEVFPSGVDPLTRRSPTQGWRFDIGGDVNDDAIMWGGFFRGRPTVITKRNIYIIESQSQADWGPMSILRVFNFGCIAGDTVREVNGVLYWVAPGPRIMRWTGIQRYSIFDTPEVVSHLRVNARLANAPQTSWSQWFGAHHVKFYGMYYCLYFTPQGQSTNTQRIDYNSEADCFESSVYYDLNGNPLSWGAAETRDGGSDFQDLYQAATNGQIFQSDVGTLDNGLPIKIRGASKKFPLAMVAQLHTLFVRLSAVVDSLTITVTVGGSEYPQQSQPYTIPIRVGPGDVELKQRLSRFLKGRWVQVQISGNVSNGAAVRDLTLYFLNWRANEVSH